MISDIFIAANNYFKFNEVIKDMQKFTKLTDNIISEIKAIDDKETDDEGVKKAKSLIKRISKRDLYTFVGEYTYKDKEVFMVSFNVLFSLSLLKRIFLIKLARKS